MKDMLRQHSHGGDASALSFGEMKQPCHSWVHEDGMTRNHLGQVQVAYIVGRGQQPMLIRLCGPRKQGPQGKTQMIQDRCLPQSYPGL